MLAIGFEPDQRDFAQLESSTRRRYFPVALWERSEPVTLYCSRGGGKSSLLRPRPETFHAFPEPERLETVDEVPIPAERVQSLDRVLSDDGVDHVDFIKLDTQGTELPILRGASTTLATAVGLKVEVEFVELYEGQPLFADVDAFLRAAGFQLMDLQRGYWKRNGHTAFLGAASW